MNQVSARLNYAYEARYRAPTDARAAMVRAYERLAAGYLEANPGADAAMRKAIDEELAPARRVVGNPSEELVAAYVSVVPCVELFVSTELDTTTPGSRGLGRSSDRPPRLGGVFREQLASSTACRDFGGLIEELFLETYCATATELLEFFDPPTRPVAQPAAEVFERWVPSMYAGTRRLGQQSLATIGAFQAESERTLKTLAEEHGLLKGLRKSKRERDLVECAGFWTAAAAALYWVPAQM